MSKILKDYIENKNEKRINIQAGKLRENLVNVSGVDKFHHCFVMKNVDLTFIQDVSKEKFLSLRNEYQNMSIDAYLDAVGKNPSDLRYSATFDILDCQKSLVLGLQNNLNLDQKYADGTTARENLEVNVDYSPSTRIVTSVLSFIDENKVEFNVKESDIENAFDKGLTQEEKKELNINVYAENLSRDGIVDALISSSLNVYININDNSDIADSTEMGL